MCSRKIYKKTIIIRILSFFLDTKSNKKTLKYKIIPKIAIIKNYILR